MSKDKKRDRALQRRVHERQAKTGESYQAAWRQLTGSNTPPNESTEEETTDTSTANDLEVVSTANDLEVVSTVEVSSFHQAARQLVTAATAAGLGGQPAIRAAESLIARLILSLYLPPVLAHQTRRAVAR